MRFNRDISLGHSAYTYTYIHIFLRIEIANRTCNNGRTEKRFRSTNKMTRALRNVSMKIAFGKGKLAIDDRRAFSSPPPFSPKIDRSVEFSRDLKPFVSSRVRERVITLERDRRSEGKKGGALI